MNYDQKLEDDFRELFTKRLREDAAKMEKVFKYVVNTFARNYPVQLRGEIIAYSEEDVVRKLCFCQGIYRGGYEFLSIDDVSDRHIGSDDSDDAL